MTFTCLGFRSWLTISKYYADYILCLLCKVQAPINGYATKLEIYNIHYQTHKHTTNKATMRNVNKDIHA